MILSTVARKLAVCMAAAIALSLQTSGAEPVQPADTFSNADRHGLTDVFAGEIWAASHIWEAQKKQSAEESAVDADLTESDHRQTQETSSWKRLLPEPEGAEDHRHGDHHPPVSIRVDSTPLVSRHRASQSGLGQWPTRGTMELTFYLQGAVPHFAYRIVVQEIDASNRPMVRQQEETGVTMGEDASSQPVTVTFRILDAEQSAYRFVIAAWDAYPGLTAEEGLLARRDLTVSLRKERNSEAKGAEQVSSKSPRKENRRQELWRMAEALDDLKVMQNAEMCDSPRECSNILLKASHSQEAIPQHQHRLHSEDIGPTGHSEHSLYNFDHKPTLCFEAPTCVAGQPTVFECRLAALQPRVEYLLSVSMTRKPTNSTVRMSQVGNETAARRLWLGAFRTNLFKDTWILDNIEDRIAFNITIPALSTSQLNCPEDCHPQHRQHSATIRLELRDSSNALLAEASRDLPTQEATLKRGQEEDNETRTSRHEHSDVEMDTARQDNRQQGSGTQDYTTQGPRPKEHLVASPNTSCALLFFGLVKRFREVVLPSIRDHLLTWNPSCDIFVHTSNITSFSNPANVELDCAIRPHEVYLLTANVIMDDDDSYKKARPDYISWREFHPSCPGSGCGWIYPNSMDNLMKQYHSIDRVWKLMEASGKRYDRVGLFRLDLLITRPIILHADNTPGVACEPSMQHGGLCDRMFYGDFKVARQWASDRFSKAREYVRIHKELTI